ncbi:MAG: hypothetical protein Q7K57_03760 [Burkholderiaceae bacterium]|nr:hypothetical protein [Burkholderiaceae bacterium]
MQRPKLEIASWIAGIIGTLVAVVTLAYQFMQPFQGSSAQAATAQPSSAKPLESVPSQVVGASSPPDSAHRASLRAGLEAAKRLNNYTEREDAILRIVRAAIKDDYYKFAHDASHSLNVYANRDAVAIAVSCHLAHRGEYGDAKDVAMSINAYTARDRSLGLITSLAATKPGEGENDYSCGEPSRSS